MAFTQTQSLLPAKPAAAAEPASSKTPAAEPVAAAAAAAVAAGAAGAAAPPTNLAATAPAPATPTAMPHTAEPTHPSAPTYARVQDSSCPEFESLLASIHAALHAPPSTHKSPGYSPLQQLINLGQVMEKLWQPAGYTAAMQASATPLAGANTHSHTGASTHTPTSANAHTPTESPLTPPLRVPSAFGCVLRNSAWLLRMGDEPARPSELYLKSAYERFLKAKV